MQCCEVCVAVDCPAAIGADADGDDLVGVAGQGFPDEGDAVVFVLHGDDGGVEIEFTAVVGCLFVAGEVEEEVAEGLVGDLAKGDAHELVHGEFLGLSLLAFEEKAADFGEVVGCTGVGVVAWSACPEGVFVELDAVVSGTTEDHGAEATVADGECFHPVAGRFVVPEFGGTGDGWFVGLGGEGQEGNQEEGEGVSHGVVS